jgi:hypothetical protein
MLGQHHGINEGQMTQESEGVVEGEPGPGRLPYVTPKLARYGAVQAVTLTVNENMNKNDAIQGQTGLKT